jgi:hypothetical protein
VGFNKRGSHPILDASNRCRMGLLHFPARADKSTELAIVAGLVSIPMRRVFLTRDRGSSAPLHLGWKEDKYSGGGLLA